MPGCLLRSSRAVHSLASFQEYLTQQQLKDVSPEIHNFAGLSLITPTTPISPVANICPTPDPPTPLSIVQLQLDIEIRLLDSLISSMTSSTYLLRQQGRSNLTNYKVKPGALNKNCCSCPISFNFLPPTPAHTYTLLNPVFTLPLTAK